MILRTRCPTCGATYRLQEPLPPEGKRYRCTCKTVITISYPEAVRKRIHATQLSMEQEDATATQPVGTAPVTAAELATVPPVQEDDSPSGRRRGQGTDTAPPSTQQAGHQTEETLRDRAARSRAEAHLSKPPSIPPMRPARPLPKSPFGDEASTLRRPPPENLDEARDGEVDPDEGPTVVESMNRPFAGPMQLDRQLDEDSESTELASPRPADEGHARIDHSGLHGSSPVAYESDLEDDVPTTQGLPGVGKSPPSKPKRSRSARFLRALAIVVLTPVLLGVIWLIISYSFWGNPFGTIGKDLPSVDSLARYEPPVVTVVQDSTGKTLGEFYEQQRYVVPLEQIPDTVRNAFIAAEDASFWEHSGLDYKGIVRAMVKNVQEGRMAQGASTITQQVARTFLLTREKKLTRKIKEAILASRIENNFEKEHILFLYLNQIYLGHGAYGVQAAARLYFGKSVSELNLPEAAIIAGLPQAPANYSPNKNFQAAKDRQRYVLNQMARRGYITQEDADAAYERELVFSKKHNVNLDYAPFYVEHVRRYLVKTYGHYATYNQGLQVTIPIDTELQQVANKALKKGVRVADKRIGYRGAEKLAGEAAIAQALIDIDRIRTLALRPYDPSYELPEGAVPDGEVPALQEGEYSKGVVAEVSRKWALVDVGSLRGLLPVDEFKWCHNVNTELNFNWFVCKRLDDVIHKGDLIEVRVVNANESWKKTLGRRFKGPVEYPRLAMEQDPDPQGALLSLRLSDGAVLAMVGGSSFSGSEFNRAIQAKRQVGSTFKPAGLRSRAGQRGEPAHSVDDPGRCSHCRATRRQGGRTLEARQRRRQVPGRHHIPARTDPVSKHRHPEGPAGHRRQVRGGIYGALRLRHCARGEPRHGPRLFGPDSAGVGPGLHSLSHPR
jgi:hypothetical protein